MTNFPEDAPRYSLCEVMVALRAVLAQVDPLEVGTEGLVRKVADTLEWSHGWCER